MLILDINRSKTNSLQVFYQHAAHKLYNWDEIVLREQLFRSDIYWLYLLVKGSIPLRKDENEKYAQTQQFYNNKKLFVPWSSLA